MNRISARSRIVIGLVALMVSVMMLAVAIGLVPSETDAIKRGRLRVCEAMAVAGSVSAARQDAPGLEATLKGIALRDKDILSAAVITSDEKTVATIGDHNAHWNDKSVSGDSHVEVPIFSDKERWGTVQVRFRALTRGGIVGWMMRPATLLIAFVGTACFILFMLYLKKVLQHLDPSKVVPGRVRSALDTLAEGLLVIDSAERVVLANESFAQISGRTSEELLGCRVQQLPWVREENDETPQPWTLSLQNGEPQRNVQIRLRDCDSRVRTFVVNCSPVMGQDGKNKGVLASFEDVTVLEQQKVELHKSKEAAESANRAKSEFLARMSHEIRTPMNAIIGFADVLRRGFDENEAERQEYLETIHASGQHLLELINDILDLSKIESGKIQLEISRSSPHQIISDAIAVLRDRAKQKGIRLDYKWNGSVPATIETDPTRLRQVVTNLIGNAIKFTEKGGVTVVARMADDKLAIDVTDTGIGIRAESVDNLFQPFMQADTSITRRFGGTGLGLSISRQLAEAMGGAVTVKSEYGKGSTFTCTVTTGSLDDVEMLAVMPTTSQRVDTHGSGVGALPPTLRVLSVDDGTSNQKLITLVIRRAGAAVIDTAANGRDGVALALKNKYDVILMDMQMPIMDGYTAARTLREKGFTVPIIALTAHAMKEEETKCLAAGCTAFLPKPIDVDDLLAKVAEVCGLEIAPARTTTAGQSAAPSRAAARTQIQSTLPLDDADFREVVEEFAVRLREQLGNIESAWEQRELARVADLAHWLKGSGGTAGFDAFTSPARRLETLANEHRLDEIEDAINELQQLASQVVTPSTMEGIKS